MPKIENVSRYDINDANHMISNNSILIQISDQDLEFPTPEHKFLEIYKFQFLDIEWDGEEYDDISINDEQAEKLVNILYHALDNNFDVVVHCSAGVSRSGAVVEIGERVGFTPTHNNRTPNRRAVKKMLQYIRK